MGDASSEWLLLGVALLCLCAGAAGGYLWRHHDAQRTAARQSKKLAQLEQFRKTASERIPQMREQIAGLTKTVAELRQLQHRYEAEKRRREMMERVLNDNPQTARSAEAASPKGPRSTFADTEVLDDK
jgi:TolA-binding protein